MYNLKVLFYQNITCIDVIDTNELRTLSNVVSSFELRTLNKSKPSTLSTDAALLMALENGSN